MCNLYDRKIFNNNNIWNMNELTNEEFSQMMQDDKMHNYMPGRSGKSDCCGAPVIDDYEMCSECKEHCDRSEAKLCYGCETEIEDHQIVCESKECWGLYKSEHFDDN